MKKILLILTFGLSIFLYIPIVPDPAQTIVFLLFTLLFFVFSLFKIEKTTEISHSNSLISISILAYCLWAIVVFFTHPIHSESVMELSRILFYMSSFIFFKNHFKNYSFAQYAIVGLGAVYIFSAFEEYQFFFSNTNFIAAYMILELK